MTGLIELKRSLQAVGTENPSLAIERSISNQDLLRYRQFVPINECGESLVDFRDHGIRYFSPHPYQSVGAPYGTYSPFCLRSGVLERLLLSQGELSRIRPGYRLCVFDAFRPVSVQRYMVDFELTKLAQSRGIELANASPSTRTALETEVLKFWARPDPNPLAPPPHSTGSAVDLTILDESGTPIPMGGEIDQIGDVSYPNYFVKDKDAGSSRYHENRELLNSVMKCAEFSRLPFEWWHFSLGDQLWAILKYLSGSEGEIFARYGIID